MKLINFIILSLAFLLTSCGAKSSKVSIQVSSALSQVSGLFDNGAVMIAVGGPADKPPLLYTVPLGSSTFDHTFDNGTWRIMILGWHNGATAGEMMEGSLYCSVLPKVTIPEQTSLGFNLTQVDSDSNMVPDLGHPCENFIDGLQTVKYMKLCENTDCTTGDFVNSSDPNLSLKFGVPFYEGPVDRKEIYHRSFLTSNMSTCYSSPLTNLTSGTNGEAKLVVDANTGIIIPRRLKGGFFFPLKVEGYKDATKLCQYKDGNYITSMNSVGELNATGSEIHYHDGITFIYKMPPQPFMITGIPTISNIIRDEYLQFDFNGPYNNDNYGDGTISYNCMVESGVISPQTCPSTMMAFEGGKISFDSTSGQLILDGSTYPNYFTLNETLSFSISANYTKDGVGHTSEVVSFSLRANPIDGIKTDPLPSSMTLSPTLSSDNAIAITNYSDSDLQVSLSISMISGTTPPSIIPTTTSTCSLATTCYFELDASSSDSFGEINVMLQSSDGVETLNHVINYN